MELEKTKKIRNKKKSKIISFDEETVTKDNAEQMLKDKQKNKKFSTNLIEENEANFVNMTSKKHKKKREKIADITQHISSENIEANDPSESQNENSNSLTKLKKMKRKDRSTNSEVTSLQDDQKEEQINTEGTEETKPPKKESKRVQKRKKYEEQAAAKKLKSEIGFQEKALNYLSKWKHCRTEWKFEKLRQVWLQQNLFNSNKIPDEFWQTAVEYFSGAKGQSRQQLLDEAVKVVEQEGQSDISVDEDKLKRAKDIVQNLN